MGNSIEFLTRHGESLTGLEPAEPSGFRRSSSSLETNRRKLVPEYLKRNSTLTHLGTAPHRFSATLFPAASLPLKSKREKLPQHNMVCSSEEEAGVTSLRRKMKSH